MEKDTSNLVLIAEKVLNEEGQDDIDELLFWGDISAARDYLLAGIDLSYQNREIFFEEARDLYSLLAMPLEEVCKFRQENVGDLYE